MSGCYFYRLGEVRGIVWLKMTSTYMHSQSSLNTQTCPFLPQYKIMLSKLIKTHKKHFSLVVHSVRQSEMNEWEDRFFIHHKYVILTISHNWTLSQSTTFEFSLQPSTNFWFYDPTPPYPFDTSWSSTWLTWIKFGRLVDVKGDIKPQSVGSGEDSLCQIPSYPRVLFYDLKGTKSIGLLTGHKSSYL